MSSEKNIHIIAFDVPYPADYGGVIDIFFKLKSFYEAGVKVHLHCFEYGRKPQDILKKLCASVHYYPRKTAKSLLFNTLPYIVLTRTSDALKKNLLKNNYPVLMEGLHCTFLLNDKNFSKRKIIVRTHNVEHDYYENLAKVEKQIFKRYYFYNEAGKLKKYEVVLKNAHAIAAISPNDTEYFSSHFKNVHYIPAFHPNENLNIAAGKGDFAFYHGNLSVGENNEAALFLVNKVFKDTPYKLIIAGSKPSDELIKAIHENRNIELKDHLTPAEIYELIRQAQCNILPTFQSTGIKLKLLSSLFAGRFCIVNKAMVDNTGLEGLCIIANTAEKMKEKIKEVMNKDFPKREIEKREKILMENFSNKKNIEKLIQLAF
jgi:hypothetical protein